jgi:AAA domain
MVCTYTNVAVDNLVEGFVASGLTPLRIGYGRVKQSLLDHTLDFKLSQHPLKPRHDQTTNELQNVREQIKNLGKSVRDVRLSNKAEQMKRLDYMETHLMQLERQQKRLSAKGYAIHQEMLQEIVSDADVVRIILLLLAQFFHSQSLSPGFPDLYDLHQFCLGFSKRC